MSKLTSQGNSVFVSPFNKMVNENQDDFTMGRFKLNDFVSTTPLVDVQLSSDNETKATGSIQVNSDVGTKDDIPATMHITASGNNLSDGSTEDIQFDVETSTGFYKTSWVTMTSDDDLVDMVNKIANALSSVTEINDEWRISANPGDSVNDPYVELEYRTTGTDGNGYEIDIIKDESKAADASVTLDIPDPEYAEAILTIDSQVGASSDFYINVEFHGETLQSNQIAQGASVETLGNEIRDLLLGSTEITNDWDITDNYDSGSDVYDITVTAKSSGTDYNGEDLEVFYTEGDSKSNGTLIVDSDAGVSEDYEIVVSFYGETMRSGTMSQNTDPGIIADTIYGLLNNNSVISTDWDISPPEDNSGEYHVDITAKDWGSSYDGNTANVTYEEVDTGNTAPGPSDTTADGSDLVTSDIVTTSGGDAGLKGGDVEFTYDTDTVNVTLIEDDTLDNVIDDIVTAINNGDIGITADKTGTDEITYTAKTVGSSENGKNVSYTDVDNTELTVTEAESSLSGGEDTKLDVNENSPSSGGGGAEGDIELSVWFGTKYEVETLIEPPKTASELAEYLKNEINDHEASQEVTAEIDPDDSTIVNIEANEVGNDKNYSITVDTDSSLIDTSVTGMSGGTYSSGGLDQEQVYWYAVRYVYEDGHKTKLCFPRMVKTGVVRTTVKLTIETIPDLFDGYAEIEIFRRTGSGSFGKIDQIETPDKEQHVYYDTGKLEIGELDDQVYLWNLKHGTHDEVKDRYVRANLSFPDIDYDTNGTSVRAVQLSEIQDGDSEEEVTGTKAEANIIIDDPTVSQDFKVQVDFYDQYMEGGVLSSDATVKEVTDSVHNVLNNNTEIGFDWDIIREEDNELTIRAKEVGAEYNDEAIHVSYEEVNSGNVAMGAMGFTSGGSKGDSTDDGGDSVDTEDKVDGALFNSRLEVFAQPRFESGVEGHFTSIGSVQFDEDTFESGEGGNYGIEIDQNEFTEDIKEVGYYGKYGIRDPEMGLKMNTIEIYNEHIPSIATHSEPEGDQETPSDPHLFLGWRYITRFTELESSLSDGYENKAYHVVIDEDWDTDPDGTSEDVDTLESDSFYIEHVPISSSDKSDALPFKITVNVMGRELTYFKVADSEFYSDNLVNGNDQLYKFCSAVYELGYFQALKSAAEMGALTVSLDPGESNKKLSSIRSNKDYEDAKIPVKAIIDTSDKAYHVQEMDEGVSINSPSSARVYAVIDSGDIYSDIDNESFNRNNASWHYDDKNGHYDIYPLSDNPVNFRDDFRASFIFNGLRPFSSAPSKSESSSTVDSSDGEYRTFSYKWPFIVFDEGVFLESDQLVYLGALKNGNLENQALDTLGYTKRTENDLIFYELNEHNIYEQAILKSDVDGQTQQAPQMISWSEPAIEGTSQYGLRTFVPTNIKVLGQKYGDILDIRPHMNSLLVFCERGVNRINVGESLTQQGSGQVYVESSQFLATDRWIMKKLPGMYPKSIMEYNHAIYFCDGVDVWRIGEGPENISNGAIELEGDTVVGAIDPDNKEYRITDGDKTWAYSIEMNEWYGPFTYKEGNSTYYRNRLFGIPGSSLVEHNKGWSFDGISYDTIVESVATDTENPVIDKLWRKLFVILEKPDNPNGTLELEYGKGPDNMYQVNLLDSKYKTGKYHVGVNKSQKNSSRLIWRITTNLEDFVLRTIGFTFKERNRP